MTRDPSAVPAEFPLVGMVHLPPLPGSPDYAGDDRERIRDRAVRDAEALDDGGMDAVLVENYGDAPYYPESVPAHVVAEMTDVARAVTDAVDCPVGVNVLRNDAAAALSVAAAVGAAFVRVNVHVGAAVTDQGVLTGQAHETLRLRERIDAGDVAVWGDVDVKHASGLGDSDLRTEVEEVVDRGGADGVIVSGPATGRPTSRSTLQAAREAVDALDASVSLLVGSGVTSDSVGRLLSIADGAIVGTALKEGGVTDNPVNPERVRELVASAEEL